MSVPEEYNSAAFFTIRFFNTISDLANIGTIDQFLRKSSDKVTCNILFHVMNNSFVCNPKEAENTLVGQDRMGSQLFLH